MMLTRLILLLALLLAFPHPSLGFAPGLADSTTTEEAASASANPTATASPSPFSSSESNSTSSEASSHKLAGSTTGLLVVDILAIIFFFVASPFFFLWNYSPGAAANKRHTYLDRLGLAITALPNYFSRYMILSLTDGGHAPAHRRAIESSEDFGRTKAYLTYPPFILIMLLPCILFGVSIIVVDLDVLASAFVFFLLLTSLLYGERGSYETDMSKRAFRGWMGIYLASNVIFILFLVISDKQQAETPLVLAFLINFFFGLRPAWLTLTLKGDPRYDEL